MTVKLGLVPSWPDMVGAIGGGPQIVRNGGPDLSRGRGVHDGAARPAGAAQRRRPAPRRPDHPCRGRRAAARLQRRAHELGARPGARPARRGHRDGARQRRVDDDGVRRQAAEPPLGRGRAAHLDRARLPRTAGSSPPSRRARLAERRRRRRLPEPRLPGRPPLVGDGDAARTRRVDAGLDDGAAGTRHLPVAFPGTSEAGTAAVGAAVAAGRVDVRGEGGRRRRPELRDDPQLRRGRHARVPPGSEAARRSAGGPRDPDHVPARALRARRRDRGRRRGGW